MRIKIYLLTAIALMMNCVSVLNATVTDYTLTPSPAVPVSSLSTIRITFPEAKYLGMYGSSLGGVTLTKAEDPTTVYVPVLSSYSTLNNPNSQSFMLARRDDASQSPVIVDEPGTYMLHFPADCFELCGSWYSHLAWSGEIDVMYTVTPDGVSGLDNFLPVEGIGIYPGPGEVQELKSVSLQLPIDAEDFVTAPGISLVRLRRVGEEAGEYVVASCTYDLEKTVAMEFRPADSKYPHPLPVSEPGEYILTVPAGVFSIPSTGMINPAMEIPYTITGVAGDSFKDPVVTPSSGILPQIEEISVDFPNLRGEFNFPEGVTDVTNYLNGAVTLTLLADDESMQKEYIPFSATLTGRHTVTFRFRRKISSSVNPVAETIRTRGDYLLNIPPNTFKEKGNDFSFNGRIQAYYTIERPVVDSPMEIYEITPADGESVGALEIISLTFPELTNGMRWPFDHSGIRITNVDDPAETYKALSVVMQGNTVRWGFNTLDTQYDYNLILDKPGTYSIYIPAGILIDYSNPSVSNPEIHTTFTIDPRLNFTYTLTPAAGAAVEKLPEILLEATGKTLEINPEVPLSPTLSSGTGVSYDLKATRRGENAVVFNVPAELPVGAWTLTVPARYLVQTHDNGMEIYNPEEITATFRIVTPAQYEWSFNPKSGSRMTGLPVVSLTPVGDGLRMVELVEGAPLPSLECDGKSYQPSVSVNGSTVVLAFPDDLLLPAGTYTLSIPAGMIRTHDANSLVSLNAPLSATYEIFQYTPAEFDNGIFFINEGWYGTNFGSINYLDEDYREMSYKVFQLANNGRYIGVTSQYGEIFGDAFYIISKQASYTDPQGLLTVADASNMKLRHQIGLGSAEGRSILCIDNSKGYVGTASGILVYHPDTNTLGEMIQGTTSSPYPYTDQIGQMVRLGDFVYAVRQDMGVYVIDPVSDKVVAEISIPEISTIFVTAGSDLYAATTDPASPFVAINREDLSLTPVVIDSSSDFTPEETWGSWKKSTLTVAARGNVVYYATSGSDDAIARYDFDKGVFTPRFVSLPADMALYGSALSVDPMTGYLVIQAVGNSSSMIYEKNVIYFANPETGEIETDLTFRLDEYYWFPAMAVYPVASAPVIAEVPTVYLATDSGDSFTLDATAITGLNVGNPSLITYDAYVEGEGICNLERESYGKYVITPLREGVATLVLEASYRGVPTESRIGIVVKDDSGVDEVVSEESRGDIYSIDGTLVRRGSTSADLKDLPAGMYIMEGRKICITGTSRY